SAGESQSMKNASPGVLFCPVHSFFLAAIIDFGIPRRTNCLHQNPEEEIHPKMKAITEAIMYATVESFFREKYAK
ncbi:hypothetical protein KX520_26450, partial [Escherichia coli]|nr:hypothetical protein [Escherichia coli]